MEAYAPISPSQISTKSTSKALAKQGVPLERSRRRAALIDIFKTYASTRKNDEQPIGRTCITPQTHAPPNMSREHLKQVLKNAGIQYKPKARQTTLVKLYEKHIANGQPNKVSLIQPAGSINETRPPLNLSIPQAVPTPAPPNLPACLSIPQGVPTPAPPNLPASLCQTTNNQPSVTQSSTTPFIFNAPPNVVAPRGNANQKTQQFVAVIASTNSQHPLAVIFSRSS
ncbi:hypothetical protein VP01_169g2 [Puccinia sorghi]|uniref:Uncharacterized protein n=1 Tax=Puccinia sorghi TaxID=27349 RepID=A0A0L6VFP6_9BASI|nr:hypothetical protein VP01_169g2 [Puccinia sorghi]